jgi:sugar-specific transcriptional regulator TrmB
MNEELISQIEDLGLSNKEARVYVANLMIGPAGVQQIADASGIKRVTTYVILESLVNLGLVSQTTKAKKTLFNAEAPENLARLLERKEKQLREQKDQLKNLLPGLENLKTLPKDIPSVKFFEGQDGIRTVVKSFISDSKRAGVTELYGISNLDQLYEAFPEIAAAQSNPDRLSAGIHSKIIYTTERGAIYKKADKDKNRESRFLPVYKFILNGEVAIVGDRIAMVSFTGYQPIGVIITSKELAQTFKTLFELGWEAAAKYEK